MCHYNYSDVGNSGTDDVSQVNCYHENEFLIMNLLSLF